MRWLQDIIERINTTVVNSGVEDPVGEGEEVVGEVPEGLKKTFCYLGALSKKMMAMIEEHYERHALPGHTSEMCEAFGRSLELLEHEQKAVSYAFWNGLRAELNLPKESLCIQDGFKVVIKTPEDPAMGGASAHILDLRVGDGKKHEGRRSQ